MKRTIITYGGYFERFMMTLNAAERRKIDYILSLLESGDRVPVKFMRLIRDGLYELRMEFGGNCYRIFSYLMKETSLFCSTDSARKVRRHHKRK